MGVVILRARSARRIYCAPGHAFVFVALSVNGLVKFTRVPVIRIASAVIVLPWLPVYGHLALRRVYAAFQATTLLSELGIGALYAASAVPAVVVLALWVAARAG